MLDVTLLVNNFLCFLFHIMYNFQFCVNIIIFCSFFVDFMNKKRGFANERIFDGISRKKKF